jgi:hypothetical protein
MSALLQGLPLQGMQLGSRSASRARRERFDLRSTVIIHGLLDKHSTDLAFLIVTRSAAVWVPRALVKHDPQAGTFAMPLWLARQKGLQP